MSTDLEQCGEPSISLQPEMQTVNQTTSLYPKGITGVEKTFKSSVFCLYQISYSTNSVSGRTWKRVLSSATDRLGPTSVKLWNFNVW